MEHNSPEERLREMYKVIQQKKADDPSAPIPKTFEAYERLVNADHHKFQEGHPYFSPKTPEAAQRQLDTKLKNVEKQRWDKNPAVLKKAVENSHAAMRGMPKVTRGDNPTMENSYKSFAKMIRGITDNGWELVEAVHTMFQEAYAERNFDRTINAATWLADRGFGKPVQVTALTDAEGNPVAFQLWQPAANEQGDVAEEPPLVITQYAKPNLDLSAPPTPAEKQSDRFALGPARIWGVEDKEPGPGE